MKKFLGAVSKSEELTAKIGAMGKDELNDDDLDAVAGDTKDSNDKTCACVIAGYGYDI